MAAPIARFIIPLRFCQRVYIRPCWREQQYSSESSSQDNDDKNKKKDEKQRAALEKLNSLLTSMKAVISETPQQSISKSLGLNLAKPSKYVRKEEKSTTKAEQIKKEEDYDEESSDSDLEPEIVSAVKDVASSLGGDVKKTEIELLKKLTDPILPTKEKKDFESQAHKINISNIFLGMKIDRSKPQGEAGQMIPPSEVNGIQSRFAREVKREGLSAKMRSEITPVRRTRIDLFGSGKLDIFQKKTVTSEQDKDVPHLKTWEKLDNHEYKLLVTHPPANAFEEMILWTDQGKLWKFPINNEEGLEEEEKVPFYEHVFLEPLLEEGFPKRGPVRHFMELVVTGLSKNPYLTVTQKHEHIDWFRQYFQKKTRILEEVGALA